MACSCSITEITQGVPGGQGWYEFELDLTAIGSSARVFIPTNGYDSCSIHIAPLSHVNFNGGVVSVKKTNDKNLAPVALGTGVTLAIEQLKELVTEEWVRAAFLTIEVTTASSTAGTRARGVVVLKRLGYTVGTASGEGA